MKLASDMESGGEDGETQEIENAQEDGKFSDGESNDAKEVDDSDSKDESEVAEESQNENIQKGLETNKEGDDFNEVILFEESTNGASNSFGANEVEDALKSKSDDPLDCDWSDPLELGDEDETGKKITKKPGRPKVNAELPAVAGSVPVIKINRVSEVGEDQWKIKSKLDSPPDENLPQKRNRATRQVVSYAEIDEDDLPVKKGRIARVPVGLPKPIIPQQLLTPKSLPRPLLTPKSVPRPLLTPKSVSKSRQNSLSVKSPAKAAETSKEPLLPSGIPSGTKKGRKKRTISEDSFEILPFKRRQFKSAELEDEIAKDEILVRASTPDPNVDDDLDDEDTSSTRRSSRKSSAVFKKTTKVIKKLITPNSKLKQKTSNLSVGMKASKNSSLDADSDLSSKKKFKKFSVKKSKLSKNKDVHQDILEKSANLKSKKLNFIKDELKSEDSSGEKPEYDQDNSVSTDVKEISVLSDTSVNKPFNKRGRPRKTDQGCKPLSTPSASKESSNSFFDLPPGSRRSRSKTSGADEFFLFEETNSSFGDWNENEDQDDDYSSEIGRPKSKHKRLGPSKSDSIKGFPKLTADELEMARKSGCWQCKVCDRKLSSQWSLDTHVLTVHGSRTFICDICQKAFKRKDHLINHRRSIHLVRNKSCTQCDVTFTRKTELVSHMKAVHPKSSISTAEVKPGDEIFYEEPVKKQPKTPMSAPKKKVAEDIANLLNGFEGSSMGRGDLFDDFESPFKKGKKSSKKISLDESLDSLERKKRGRPKKPVVEFDKKAHRRCPDCKKVFSKASQLPGHQRQWHIKHPCVYCHKVYEGLERLDAHLEQHRIKQTDGSYLYACTHCPGTFSKEACLAQHSRDFHLEEHCLACGSCIQGALLMHSHVLESHPPEKIERDIMIFGNDSPDVFYQCSECPRSFYEFFEAEHHFLKKHVVLGDCNRALGVRPPQTWWPWAQLYPQLDIYADNRVLHKQLFMLDTSKQQRASQALELLERKVSPIKPVVSKKSAAPECCSLADEIENIWYHCQFCDDLFPDHDLLEVHLVNYHMATCMDLPSELIPPVITQSPDYPPLEYDFELVEPSDSEKSNLQNGFSSSESRHEGQGHLRRLLENGVPNGASDDNRSESLISETEDLSQNSANGINRPVLNKSSGSDQESINVNAPEQVTNGTSNGSRQTASKTDIEPEQCLKDNSSCLDQGSNTTATCYEEKSSSADKCIPSPTRSPQESSASLSSGPEKIPNIAPVEKETSINRGLQENATGLSSAQEESTSGISRESEALEERTSSRPEERETSLESGLPESATIYPKDSETSHIQDQHESAINCPKDSLKNAIASENHDFSTILPMDKDPIQTTISSRTDTKNKTGPETSSNGVIDTLTIGAEGIAMEEIPSQPLLSDVFNVHKTVDDQQKIASQENGLDSDLRVGNDVQSMDIDLADTNNISEQISNSNNVVTSKTAEAFQPDSQSAMSCQDNNINTSSAAVLTNGELKTDFQGILSKPSENLTITSDSKILANDLQETKDNQSQGEISTSTEQKASTEDSIHDPSALSHSSNYQLLCKI